MQKKFKFCVLLLCLVLVLTVVLTGCDNGIPTTVAIRWADTETLSYEVSLALKTTNSAFKIEKDEKVFVNNFELISDEGGYDEFRPSEVNGTFDMTISTASNNQTLETVQYIECLYRSADYENFDVLKGHVDSLSEAEKALVVVSVSDSEILLKSQTSSKVVFQKSYTQTPVSSEKTIKGYYAGILNFEVNDIVCTTTYDQTTATVTILKNGQKTVDAEKYTVASSRYIDVAQILLYQRSLEQGVAFTQATTVAVFDPVSAKTILLSFAINLNTATILKLNNGSNLATTTFISASTNSGLYGVNLFAFFNNPNDKLPATSTGELNKFTPVKWQSGFLLYELSSYTEQQVSELEYKAE